MAEEYRVLPFRIEENKYRALRKLSYLHEISMAEMIRALIDEKIKEHKKVLTNSDITI